MIADLKPYPAMKDSGVEWLGEVPEHWEVRRIKTLFREKEGRSGDGKGLLLSLTRAKGLIPQSEASNRLASASDLSKYKVCIPGDLVMNRMQAWSGMFAVAHHEGLVSPDYSVFQAVDPCEVGYFEQLYKTPVVVDQFAQASKGIGSGFNRLYTPEFGAIPSLSPPVPEQAAIVRYLDHVDRRVRRLTRAKRKLIALLTEQKQAIIHRAVTRGLDPDVPLKDSGVEWLGEVPEHWEVRKLKFEMTFRGGGTPSKAEPSYWGGKIPWVSPKDMKSKMISDAQDHITEQAVIDSSTNLVPAGSILMVVRSGILQRTIPIGICDREVALNQDMKALSVKQTLNAEFFTLMVRGCEKLLLREWTKQGATVESIEHEFLANSEIPLPPLPEQAAIVEHLDQATAEIDTTITRAEREIELLNEYRTRLIADVVTGKLDVRDAAAALPEVDPLAEADNADDLDADLALDADELDETPEEAEA